MGELNNYWGKDLGVGVVHTRPPFIGFNGRELASTIYAGAKRWGQIIGKYPLYWGVLKVLAKRLRGMKRIRYVGKKFWGKYVDQIQRATFTMAAIS